VDAFYKSTTLVEDIIWRLGEEHRINPIGAAWLNNAVAAIEDWPEPRHCRNIYSFSNLTVDEVTTEYLLGMKAQSGREQDSKDVEALLKILKIKDPLEVYRLLRSMTIGADIASILTTFTRIKGEEWFEAYYIAHSEEILNLLRGSI